MYVVEYIETWGNEYMAPVEKHRKRYFKKVEDAVKYYDSLIEDRETRIFKTMYKM